MSCFHSASLIAQLVKKHLQCRRSWFNSWVGKIPGRRNRLPTPVFLGFPGGSVGKESTCNLGDLDQSLGWEDRLGKGIASTPIFWPGEFHVQFMGSQWVWHNWVTFTFIQHQALEIHLVVHIGNCKCIPFYCWVISYEYIAIVYPGTCWVVPSVKLLLFFSCQVISNFLGWAVAHQAPLSMGFSG